MNLSKLQRITLYIFFFSTNFEVWDPFNTGGNFSIAKFCGFLYFASILPNLPYFFKVKLFKKTFSIIATFFVFLSVMGLVNINYLSPNFFDFSIFQNILLWIILINHSYKDEKLLDKAMLVLSIGAVVTAVFYYLGIGVEISLNGRISLFGDNENTIGIRMCIAITYLSYLVFQNKLGLGDKRYLLLIPIPLMISLMISTGSRVAIISFGAIFITELLMIKTKNISTKVIIFILGFFFALYVFNLVTSSDVLYNRLVNSAENEDLGGRADLWVNLIPLIENNIFFGVGKTGYEFYTVNLRGKLFSPHNVILEVLSYTGIVGLFLFFLFLWNIYKYSVFKYKRGAIIHILLLIPLLGLILSGQMLSKKVAWIIFAYAIGKTLYNKRSNENIKIVGHS